MDIEYLQPIFRFLDAYYLQVFITAALILIHAIVKSLMKRVVKRHAAKNEFHYSREIYIRKLINISLMLVLITLIGAIWEISFQGLSFYFASIFTIVGVALFANWSILSNLTASVIIFFFLPYRVGDTITVMDGDHSVSGIIRDIGLFQVILMTKEGKRVAYFNNLFLQKPVEYID